MKDKKRKWIDSVISNLKVMKKQTPQEFERHKEKLLTVLNASDQAEQQEDDD